MNLTLKQLFKFGAVCVSACALNAVATDYVSDSFEEGPVDGPIGEYKQVAVGQDVTTNWFAQSGDASVLAITNAAYADISNDGPITSGVSELILNLATEGNTLSRAVTNVLDIAAEPVWVDTLIQFTPSEDAPTIDDSIKVALYVNSDSNLVVRHWVYDDAFETAGWATNSIIDSLDPINPEAWYRLSLKCSEMVASSGFMATEVYIDGSPVTSANAYYTDYNKGGTFFLNVDTVADVTSISFQGTGSLDELVVSNEEPYWYPAGTAVMLTLAYSGPGVVTFTAATVPVTEVESGTEVVMTVNDWYQMGAATSAEGTFADSDSITTDGVQTRTTTFTADNDCTVTVPTAVLAGSEELGGVTYDLTSLAGWALANSLTQADVIANAAAYEDNYLLNVAPTVNATLVITSIVIDENASTTTITVEATGDGDAVDFENLNGEVTVYTTADLTAAFTVVGSFTVTDVHDTATVVIPGVVDQFLKAKVEVQP